MSSVKRKIGRPRKVGDPAERKREKDEEYRRSHREAIRQRDRCRIRVIVSEETMTGLREIHGRLSLSSYNEVLSVLLASYEEGTGRTTKRPRASSPSSSMQAGGTATGHEERATGAASGMDENEMETSACSSKETTHSLAKHKCCVPGCKSASKRHKKYKKYPWMRGVTFLPFPTRTHKRLQWIRRIRRPPPWQPTQNSRLCSRHFVAMETDGKGRKVPSKKYPYPELFPWNDWTVTSMQGSGIARQGVRRSGSHLSDWSVVDVAIDDELGWEMEGEESLSPSLQGEQWMESSHRNLPPPSESQDWSPPPGQASRDEGHASQQSAGQDTPPGSKRRKLQAAYCVPPPVEERLPQQTSQTRDADPKVVILTPAHKPVQLSTSMTGQNPGVSTDSVKIVSIEDICYANTVVQAETEPGGCAPYPAVVQKADCGDGGLIGTSKERGSLPSLKSSHTAGGAASTTPASLEYSSNEDQGPLGYCFTCEDPLLSSDLEKKHLLTAVQGKTKLLHILRQMGWPGLYSHDCRSRSCCGDCAQLLCEYNDMLRALHALKGKWMQWTGHNSAPHFNQFHHEAFMTRDSCIESSRSNYVSTERRNHHVQGPRKEQLSNQFTKVNTVSNHHSASENGSCPKDTNGICQDLNSGHVSDIESPHIDDPHQDVEPQQISDLNISLKERRKTPVDVKRAESTRTGLQILPSQHHKPVLEITSSPHTVTETSKQASQSYHQLQPGIADDDPSAHTPGQRITGKDGLSDREEEMLDRGTTKQLTTCPDSASDREISMEASDSTPPRTAVSPDKQLVQAQKEDLHDNDDVGPNTDHNFDPGQDQLSVTIKQEQEDFSGDEVFPETSDDPGGSGLTLQSLDTRWDSPDGR